MDTDKDTILQLTQYGLSDKEALFYYTALQMPSFTISSISFASELKRPTCYLLVENLIQKGLISRLASGRKKLYKAESPNVLMDIIETQKSKTTALISKLHDVQNLETPKTEIQLYSGRSGIQKVYKEMISKEEIKDIYYFGSVEGIVESVGEVFLDHWINERIKKGIWAHGVRMESEEFAKKLYESSLENLRELSFPPESFSIKNTIYLYGDTFILIGKGEIDFFALRIKNSDLVETMMSLYESVKTISKN